MGEAKAATVGSSSAFVSGRLGRNLRGALATLSALLVLAGIGASTASAAAPVVTIEPASNVEYSTAHLSGEVNPEDHETFYRFEYITEAQYMANLGAGEPLYTGATETATESLAENTGPTPVQADLSGLDPETAYQFRLVASNESGDNAAFGAGFTTKGPVTAPVVENVESEAVFYTTATAKGEVTAGNADPAFNSPCFFQYIPNAQYEENIANSLDPFEGASGEGCNVEPTGTSATPVQAHLTNLAPGTEYHLRLLATNLGGTTTEEASTFTTKAVAKPIIGTIEAPSPINAGAMRYFFAGHVNPNAPESEAQLQAEVESGEPAEVANAEAIKAAFATHWSFSCEPVCPSLEGDLAADNSSHLVSGEVENLEPNTAYTLTLHATDLGGEESKQVVFHTPAAPPGVLTGTNTPDPEGDGVTVRAYVNPRNSAVTACHFRFGLTQSYGEEAPCEGTPGSGGEAVEVTIHPHGLQAGATYHFAVLATNGAGTTQSDDSTFAVPAAEPETCPNEARRAEQHSTFLPDCRAYEMVSPPDKNGGDVMIAASHVRSAAEGGAVSFASLTGFGDVRGGGASTEYMSIRNGAGQGWSTHSITPPQKPLTLLGVTFAGLDPTFDGELSADLSTGIFRTASPLTSDPNVANVQNLYVAHDLRSADPSRFGLLTACPGCSGPLPSVPFALNELYLDGASADFSHVLFESTNPLTADAPPEISNLYESQEGTVRLAGILPDSACGSPPCIAAGALAGKGSAIGFSTPHVISADGSRIIFTDPATGNLYMRVDNGLPDAHTIQLNASERTPADASAGAEYQDATPDGSRVFFTSTEQLTNDPNAHVDRMLYMYDVHPDAQGHHLTLLSKDGESSDDAITTDSVAGMIGASDDGSYVYWIGGSGQLAAGGPTDPSGPLPGTAKLYLWHEGTVTYIGATPAEEQDANLQPQWRLLHRQARVTPDGRHMLFLSMSGAGLTGYDHGSCPGNNTASHSCQQLYLYSADTHQLVCASCAPSGAPASADASDFAAAGNSGAAASTFHLPHALSDDGRFAFFTTQESLLPGDTNGKLDAYEYDAETGRVRLLSSGTDESDSYFLDAGASGEDVFIGTRQQLLGWDSDGNYDLYDARIGGGFPEPPATAECCCGEACRSGASPAPPPSGTGSAGFQGPVNPVSHRHRRRHHRHRKHVPRRHHRNNSNHRRAAK